MLGLSETDALGLSEGLAEGDRLGDSLGEREGLALGEADSLGVDTYSQAPMSHVLDLAFPFMSSE